MADEFVETYPCYFPMKGSECLTVISGGDRCIPLLTDRDVVERFFRDRYPNAEGIHVEVQTFRDRDELVSALQDLDAANRAGEHNLSHIAFDVGGQRIVARTTIREFLDHLTTAK